MFVHSQLSLQCVQQHLRAHEGWSIGIMTQFTRLGRHSILPRTACHLIYNLSIGIVLIQEQSLDTRNIWKSIAIRACRNSPTFIRLKHPLLSLFFSLSLKSAMKIRTQNFAQWTPFRGQNNGLYITPPPFPPSLPYTPSYLYICLHRSPYISLPIPLGNSFL
jgi:hypothetical protein